MYVSIRPEERQKNIYILKLADKGRKNVGTEKLKREGLSRMGRAQGDGRVVFTPTSKRPTGSDKGKPRPYEGLGVGRGVLKRASHEGVNNKLIGKRKRGVVYERERK